jgi:hypothetical protein
MSGGTYINGIQKGLVAPLVDAAGNETVAEVVGNKSDTVAGTSLVALVKQIVAAVPPTADITAIKAVTDLIPDAGAMISLAQDLTVAKEATVGALNNVSTAEVNTEVDTALNTIVPVAPTAGSLNDVLSKASGGNTFDKATDSLEAIRDIIDTNNTADQVDLDAILEDTGTTIPALIGTPTDTDISTDIVNVQTAIDAVKAITDVIPDAGAMTSIALKAENTSGDSSGTFSYLDAGGEQDVVVITTTTRKIIHGIWLDLVNMTQDGTVKCYYKVDGTNYREFNSQAFTVSTDSDGIYLSFNMGITNALKVTYTEGADETAARDLPYSVIYETKETEPA